jgi:hypothetical protein
MFQIRISDLQYRQRITDQAHDELPDLAELSVGCPGHISLGIALDSPQKGRYDLGLPLPGPARLVARPGGKSPNIGSWVFRKGFFRDVYVHGQR